jgi:hypothetical protein
MLLTSFVVVALFSAVDPCEAPRVRETSPLAAAMAQDKVLGLSFAKTAGVCGEPGAACDQMRVECSTLLASTIQKQVGFDEGQWLRDMLLPYNGGNYPMTHTFAAAPVAGDASCNVDVPTLTAAGQRRMAQAARRDSIFQEYGLYARWTQTQLQKCKERVAGDEAKAAQTRAESERLAAASVAVGAAEALKLKQAQEAAAAKVEAEKRARSAAEIEAQKQKDARDFAEKEIKNRQEAELRARDERDRDRKAAEERALKAEEERKKERVESEEIRKKEKAEAEAARLKDKEETEKKLQLAKEEAARAQKEAEDKRLVTERGNRVTQQRLTKERLVSEAEANFKHAKDEEALKKQAAVDAVSSSPAIAQAAVAEAAQAERSRIDAEKRLFEAKQKADAIVIDDSFERSAGSILAAGGGGASESGFRLGVMAAVHFGFWGTAPPEGMASGFELRLWGRYSATVGATPATASVDSLLTARYFFGAFAVGLAGELRLIDPALTTSTVRGGVGPAVAVAFVDTHETRVLFGANYLPLGNTIDTARFIGDFEVSWRFLSFHVNGATATRLINGVSGIGWQLGLYVGVRGAW